MDLYDDSDTQAPEIPAPPRRTFWQQFGGGSLSMSLIFHGILLAIGLVWVVKIIPAEPE